MTTKEIRAIVDMFFGDRPVINWEDAYKLGKLIAEREAEVCRTGIESRLLTASGKK